MKVHDLKPPDGSKKRPKRVGRGIGGRGGKTAGRGHKGQRARNTVPIWFEGGQMPLQRRVPKLRGGLTFSRANSGEEPTTRRPVLLRRPSA